MKLTLLLYYVCDKCVVAVFIWQMPLAVVRVQRVSSVAPQVSLVLLDCVRQDFTVQGETQQPQVEQQNIVPVRQWQNDFIHYSIVSAGYI